MAPLALWIRVQSRRTDRPRGRDLELYDEHGALLASARTSHTSRLIEVVLDPLGQSPHADTALALRLERRRLFPLTGRVDVRDAVSGEELGRTSRAGTVRRRDGSIIGRFRNARRLRGFVGESLFDIGVAILTGGEASGSEPSRPTGFDWIVAAQNRGRLVRAKWPFEDEADRPVPRERRPWIARWIPDRVAAFLRSLSRTPCWRLELESLPSSERRLAIAGALFAVELAHW